MQLSRRGFLCGSAAAPAAFTAPAAAGQWWLRPTSFFTANMREIDVRDIDMRKFVDDCAATNADVLCVSAAGIYAFYPSSVKYHYVTPHLNGRDFLKEAVTLGHAAGMKIVARLDFSKAREPVFQDHPDWFSRRADGAPSKSRIYYQTCIHGAYFHEAFAAKVIREILTQYEVDGFHMNAGGFPGYCYCENCKEKFLRKFGAPPPVKPEWSSPEWKRFIAWRYDSTAESYAYLHQVMEDVRKDVFWTGEVAGLDSAPWIRNRAYDLVRLSRSCSSLMPTIENLTPGLDMRWAVGMTAKYIRSVAGRPPLINLKSHMREEGWPRASVPSAEYAMCQWQALANGGNLKTTIFGIPGKCDDQRNMSAIAEVNAVLKKHRWVYEGVRPIAPIALLWSQATMDFYGQQDPKSRYAENYYGFYAALVESHLPFVVIGDEALTPERLKGFRALVLPNAACLSESQSAAVLSFARNGGGVVATLRSSLYDESGSRRSDFSLGGAFGARYDERAGQAGIAAKYLAQDEQSIRNAYMCVAGKHEAIDTIQGTSIVPLSFGLCPCEALPSAAVPLTYGYHANTSIPEEIDNPIRTRLPACIVNTPGSGRVVYFPAEVDKFYFHRRMPDYRQFLARAVSWAGRISSPVETSAPSGVEVTLFEKTGFVFVHFVNTVGRSPMDEVTELANVAAAIEVRAKVKQVRTLLAGRTLPHEQTNGRVRFNLPRLGPYEVAVIEMHSGKE